MSKATDVALRLNVPQFRAHKVFRGACRRTIVLAWGRGVGKSWFVRQLWWELVAEHDYRVRPAKDPFRGVRIVALMPTLKQFKDVHLEGMENELGPEGRWGFLRGKIDHQSGAVKFPGGSWVKPFPASEYHSRAARGLRADVLSADEADDIDRGVYSAVAVPWLSATWSLGLELLGGTPRRGRHGLLFQQFNSGRIGKRLRLGENVENLTEAERRQFAKIYSFHATYKDTPEIVSAEAAEKAEATTQRSVFAREWLCDFDAGEGLVYGGAWDERFHVRRPPDGAAWNEILIGCDHGYEDPGVFLLIGVAGSGRDATAWVLAEIYEQHRTEDWWKARLQEWLAMYPTARFYGDPSMPSRLEAYRRDCRARVQEVDNSIEDGVAAVADRFLIREQHGEDGEVTQRGARLYVSPDCPNLIRELGLYKRKSDPKDPDRYVDDIVDRDNHGPDALRYAIFNRFGGPDRRRGASPHEALG